MTERRFDPRAFKSKLLKKLEEFSKISLGLTAGIIVLFPATYQIIDPPYRYDLMLGPMFIGFLLSFLLSSLGIYFSAFVQEVKIDRSILFCSWGILIAFLSVLALFFYVTVNVWDDKTELPTIQRVTVSPQSIKVNDNVTFTVETDENDDVEAEWAWRIRPEERGQEGYRCSPNGEVSYICSFSRPGNYTVSASTGRSASLLTPSGTESTSFTIMVQP